MSTSFVYDPNDRRGLPEGGMGLFLINKIMDEVLYKTKDGTNILTMIRHIEPGDAMK
jgi:anti-sigma regulatory factor (Ser/Thr protein kinase)